MKATSNSPVVKRHKLITPPLTEMQQAPFSKLLDLAKAAAENSSESTTPVVAATETADADARHHIPLSVLEQSRVNKRKLIAERLKQPIQDKLDACRALLLQIQQRYSILSRNIRDYVRSAVKLEQLLSAFNNILTAFLQEVGTTNVSLDENVAAEFDATLALTMDFMKFRKDTFAPKIYAEQNLVNKHFTGIIKIMRTSDPDVDLSALTFDKVSKADLADLDRITIIIDAKIAKYITAMQQRCNKISEHITIITEQMQTIITLLDELNILKLDYAALKQQFWQEIRKIAIISRTLNSSPEADLQQYYPEMLQMYTNMKADKNANKLEYCKYMAAALKVLKDATPNAPILA